MRVDTGTAKSKRIFSQFSLIFLILLASEPTLAHVEKGSMPDSVAEMEYRILLEFNSQDQATRSLLGMALLRQSKLVDAEKEFRVVLQSDKKNFDALDSLGLIMTKMKRNSEAVQYLRAAIKVCPDDIMVHLHLGVALNNTGQTEEARETLTYGSILLGKQQIPSATKDQLLAEFKTVLSSLPKTTTTSLR